MNSIVLDPHMLYSALKDEFKNDLDLSSHLEISKDDLHKHYKENYAPSTPLSQPSQPSIRQPQHLFKRILLQGLIARRGFPLMNFLNSGPCHRKTLKDVTHFFIGGTSHMCYHCYIMTT